MKPTEKELLFCRFYCRLCNAREAAARAGYRDAEKTGEHLLSRPEILRQIRRQQQKLSREMLAAEAAAGLRRLAFGDISDAVRLTLEGEKELTPDRLASLDLFCVSEIKQSGNGGIEIKFFDRFKALERLLHLSETPENAPLAPLYQALLSAADESRQSI